MPSKNKKSANSSWLTAITLFGSLCASGIGVLLTLPAMPSWSWRLAFVFGGVVALLGLMYRKRMLEPPNIEKAQKKKHNLRQLLKTYPLEITTGIFVGGLATVPFAIVYSGPQNPDSHLSYTLAKMRVHKNDKSHTESLQRTI